MVDFEALQILRGQLPSVDVLDEADGDIEMRTRAVLSLLIDAAPIIFPDVVAPDSNRCPNCDVIVESTRTPYCSEHCRDVSAFVRQFRGSLQEGTIFNPDRQAALSERCWYVAGGGLPRRETMVPDRVIKKVIEREGAKCQECGALATTIDHSGSG